MSQNLEHILKENFGFEKFRPNQQAIIESILSGQDTVAIMPTGGGKSICFQLPAIIFEGTTIVISPLIALMKDQVDSLKANGISACYLNSSQSRSEQKLLLQQITAGQIKLIYIAPESLANLDTVFITQKISLIAIDEAHCISSWGHDFRPAYTNLGYLKNKFSKTPILALTATADKATREDICAQLNLQNPQKYISSFDRPNLSLDVRPALDRVKQILDFVKKNVYDCGIIYCLSRKTTEELAEKLQKAGIKAKPYHAGLNIIERSKTQDDFINDKITVVCATIAFGMGIDKANVRWVIHYNLPKNIEGYYQEIGRAGRDGKPAETILYESYGDMIQLQKFAAESQNAEFQLAKLERMKQYADALSCRRKILLSYFGELVTNDCGNCDICKNPPTFFDGTEIAQKALSAIVRLKENEGMGTIIDFLRGSKNATIFENNYQNLKTYGTGENISWFDWNQYLIQLINLGYCEIAFHEQNKIKLTTFAKKVLYNGEKVNLNQVQKFNDKQKNSQDAPATSAQNSFFESLRKLRNELAIEEQVPAYVIFNDATLRQLESDCPRTEKEFLAIDGVGRIKHEKYGQKFLELIASLQGKSVQKIVKENTFEITLKLFENSMSVSEIAKERKLSTTTIYSHLAKLYLDGYNIDLEEYVSKNEILEIENAKNELNSPEILKPYFDFFEGQMPFEKIRLALAIIEKRELKLKNAEKTEDFKD